MAKSKRRKAFVEQKRRKNAKGQKSPDSNYSRKEKFLRRHGLWGWEVPEPKPWRKRAA